MTTPELIRRIVLFFFFNDTATTEIYTLSLHDALPISTPPSGRYGSGRCRTASGSTWPDRKSTRLNSSHSQISYAVFCLKKKKTKPEIRLFPFVMYPNEASGRVFMVVNDRTLTTYCTQ